MQMRRGFTMDFRADSGETEEEKPLSVSQLTRQIKTHLEGGFGKIFMVGEIGTISSPPSGHLYITLKDDHAAIDVVLWRSTVSRLSTLPQQGDLVEIRGGVTLYEPRGRYQIVATSLRPAGEGSQRAELEKLVAKLRSEGLFDDEHKKEIPTSPKTIGVVTSASGAAVRDIIKVLRKRMPGIEIIVSHCVVQGNQAPLSIITALTKLQDFGGCDTIIIGRGGGSAEDLQAFNHEDVARAVFSCEVPVISAVGHEIDISICDLVADARAATPSEAAEMAVRDYTEIKRRLLRLQRALPSAIKNMLGYYRTQVKQLNRSSVLRRPENILLPYKQRLANVQRDLPGSLKTKFQDLRHRLELVKQSNALRKPQRMLERPRQQTDELWMALQQHISNIINKRKNSMHITAAQLEALSPLSVLSRGYSVTRNEKQKLVSRVSEVSCGERLHTAVSDCTIISEVILTLEKNKDGKKETAGI